jgi:gliding motility-associated-like protein
MADAIHDTLGSKKAEFVENKGQWNSKVLFKTDVSGGEMFLERDGISFAFRDQEAVDKLLRFKYMAPDQRRLSATPDDRINCHAYRIHFLGCSPAVSVSSEGKTNDYVNFYIGNDSRQWASDVRKYHRVNYQSLYDGIDLSVYEKNYLIKYDFTVHPGADPKKIVLQYEGQDDIRLKDDNLVIKTSVNQVIEVKPYAYQVIGGKTVKVECHFKTRGNKVSYDIGRGWDPAYDLIIDPVLIFSSYSGSTSDNWGYTATYDSHGYLYAGGNVFGLGYPTTPGAYQVSYGGASCDIAISKYDVTGTFLIYSTYLGGASTDVANSLIVDAFDQLFVLGTTSSANYPVTPGAYDLTFNGGTAYTLTYVLAYAGSDIVVTKFNAAGTSLLASTYLGGSGNDGLNMTSPLRYNYADDVRGEIMIDGNNNIYIASTTASGDFPVTSGAFQGIFNGGAQDGVVVKLDNVLSTVIWASYLGGSGNDAIYSIVVDTAENVYVSGGTTSTDFPTTAGVLKPSFQGGSADGFITHIDKTGNNILQSTYWGSSAYDQTYFVENDAAGNIFTLGQTAATGLTWVTNAAYFVNNGGQFISKMSATLDTLIWSTAFGTGNVGPDISPTAFLVDLCDKIYLSGWGGAVNGFGGTTGLPLAGTPFQTTTDGSDYYFMVMADDASALTYASYFGGSSHEHVDGGTSRFDRSGKIYQSVCAGCGGLSDFPTTPGAVSNTNNSFNCNNGVIKLDFMLPLIVADFALPPVVCAPYTVTFDNTSHTGGAGLTSHWNFGDNSTSTQFEPSHTYTTAGTYYITLVVTDTGTCNFGDSITKPILVLSNSSSVLPPEHICTQNLVQIGIPPVGDPTVTYNWTPNTYLSNSHVSNPFANPPTTTNYTVFVSNGVCTDTIRQTVFVHNLDAWPYADTVTCHGNLLLTANSSGGATSFHWSSNPNFTDWLNSGPSDSTVNLTITGHTTFYVQVSNQWCSNIDSVAVDFQMVGGTPVIQHPLCHDDCNGTATVSVSSGTAPYSYLWDTGDTTSTITNLCSDDYTVTITDAHSCIAIQTVQLTNPTLISQTLSTVDLPCEEACIGSITVNASGSTPPYHYLWSDGQTTNPATGLCAGSYSVTITDDHSCEARDSSNIIINYIFNGFHAWTDKDTIYEGQTTSLHANQISGCTYTWSPAQYVANNGSANTMVNPPETTTFYLTVEDAYGCTTTDTVTIWVVDVICEEPYVYVPNAFSPNGDNINDYFNVSTQQANQIYLVVFDRWGEKVFETYDLQTGWDGTFRGKLCDPGVFVYYCEVICYNNAMYSKKGNVTLIR